MPASRPGSVDKIASTPDSASTPQSPTARHEIRVREEVLAGESAFRKADYKQAAVHFQEIVRLSPNDWRHHIFLAYSYMRAGLPEQVEPVAVAILSRYPNNVALRQELAALHAEQGRLDLAVAHSAKAMELQPDVHSHKIAHAGVLSLMGRAAEAWEMIKPMIEAGEPGINLTRVFAEIAGRVGRSPQAAARAEAELHNPALSPSGRLWMHFAAANLYDGIGKYDLAFAHARLSNEVPNRPFDPDAHSQSVSDRIDYYTKSKLASLPRATHDSRRPVLIVGVPRSGTSLVEQILATHPRVFGAGELNWLTQAVHPTLTSKWAQGDPYPRFWNHLTVAAANELAATYLNRMNALNSSADYVTDKMPENFLLLGAAQILLPECRVIHCIRDPRDTCLSCYFTNFVTAGNYSRHLSHLARFYRDYQRLMAHWKSVLALPMLDVRYEDLIADQEGQTRRMLEFLDLPWDANCINFHQNPRNVATASVRQVRRPIYSSSVGRWKNYEKHIPELINLMPG